VGKQIAARLQQQALRYVIVEEDREIVETLRGQDIAAVRGNAADPAVLIQAHIHKASMLVVSVPDIFDVGRMMEIAKTLNPAVEIVLCTSGAEEAILLAQTEGTRVYEIKQTLADQMANHVMHRLGQQAEAHRAHSPHSHQDQGHEGSSGHS
jgi:CPA2 family monovalent cation:H+ antiporter-2